MSDPVYVIQLGSGLYLDDHGVLHQGDIPSVPSYALPGGLLTTANEIGKLSKTFQDIGGALPNEKDKAKFDEFVKKLSDLGLSGDDMAKLLGVVGKIADTIGTVFVAVGAAVALAKMLGMFNEGPSALEVLVKARFDALNKTIRALHKINQEQHLEEHRNALGAARSTVQDFVSRRDSGTMTTAQIEAEFLTLETNLKLLAVNQFIGLLDPSTYMVLFASDEYEKVWPWISGHLFRVPAGSPPQRAAFPEADASFFDHRLAVVLAPQAAQALLALVRSLTPEFRTTGHFRPTLRDFADKLARLATALRNTTLARTIYYEGDFGYMIDDFYVSDPLPGIIDPILKPDYCFVVGAMDLCNHNDAFFPDVAKAFGPPPGPSRRGSFDFRWHPPAWIERSPLSSGLVHNDGTPVVQYRIGNPKACADAANDLSLQDYSDLLVSSGYLTLVQLEAQMRHAATQPDKSETVHGDVLLQRHPQAGSEVTVVSAPGPVLFTTSGEIKAQAWREPQTVRAFVACSTQLLPRTAPLIHYRVLLRTLSSAFPPRVWGEPNYNSVQSASYMADPHHLGFQRLVLSTSFAAVLQEELLAEGSSQTEARHIERTLNFKAHTFDWWIPIQPHHGGVSDSLPATATDRHVLGNAPARPPVGLPKLSPKFALSGSDSIDIASAASVVLGLGWEEGAQTWQGHHREMLETTVQMRVKLDWLGSNIRVAIENRPEDRNYIVFLVVEETFGSIESDEQPPKVLHTAFPIPINGQLTYVPQSLFDQEREASNKQRAFAEKYAVSVDPKPGEPVFGTISMGELATEAGVARLAAALRQFEPEVLEKLKHTDADDVPPIEENPSVKRRQTVGEVRAAVAKLGAHAWTVAPYLKDNDPLPDYALGGDGTYHPRSVDVAPLDIPHLLERTVANPLLSARNQQLRMIEVELVFFLGVDWRNRWGGRWLATIQDQNPCNNCWAFAATALVETMIRIEHGFWAKRSEGDMRDGWGGPTGENWVVRDGPKNTPCVHGAGVTGAVDWITANGIADPDCYAWSSMDKTYAPTADRRGRTARIGKYEAIGNNDDAKKWLDAVGPIICNFDAYTDFSVYTGPEVYRRTATATKRGIHFMLIVGYDDVQQCWIVRNSWGKTWGMDGYGLIAYGECNIDGAAKLGLRHTNPDPWSKRRLHSGNFFESGNGAEHRNFEMIRGDAPRVRHLWRDGGSGGFAWHETSTLGNPNDNAGGAGCVGQPAATATTFNRNFEAVYWELSGRLRHWWMDQQVNAWHDSGVFGPMDVEGFPAFIQSNYGAPGNMEVVVRRKGGQLVHWWRDSKDPFTWHEGVIITEGVKMSGPSLVQANVGKQGNFYVVCVTNRGMMQLWWRDNDNGMVWKRGEVFGRRIGSTPVCMIQGQFGATDELTAGNFELCVAVGSRVEHWFRDNSALSAEVPRADNADPRFREVVYATAKASYIQPEAGITVRADVASLFIDDGSERIAAVTKAGLYNATLSADAPDRWHRLAVFGHDVKHVWGLVEGSFGFNLEVVVERTDGVLQHYFRDGEGWHEAELIDV